MALALTHDNSRPRETVAPAVEPSLAAEGQHAFRRFQRYQRVPLHPCEIPLRAPWGWAPAVEDGPVVLDGLSWAPLSGLALLRQAQESGAASLDAWVGLLPHPGWRPLAQDEADWDRGGAALDAAQADPLWLDAHWLVRCRALVDNARTANAVSMDGQTVLGRLVGLLMLPLSADKENLVVQAVEWAVAHGASAQVPSRRRNHGPRLPWLDVLERYGHSPSVVDPEKPVRPRLLRAFLDSDLDFRVPNVDAATRVWLDARPLTPPPETATALAALRQRLLDHALALPLPAARKGPRL